MMMDTLGKYHIPFFMSLFEKFGINHAVIADKRKIDSNLTNQMDESKKKTIGGRDKVDQLLTEKIINKRNEFTLGIHFFEGDIEKFLGISSSKKPNKPLNVLWHYYNNKITSEKIKEFETIINKLLQQTDCERGEQ